MAEPKRLPLAVRPSNRDETTTRDARLVNAFVEMVGEQEFHVFKRPGTVVYSSVAAAAGNGAYNWNSDIYTIFGSVLYKNGVSVGTGMDSTKTYTFSSCLGATHKLFMQNSVKGYTYDTAGGLVQVTDAIFAALVLVKGCAYLDGYMNVMTTSAVINTSNANDPTVWPALNNLVAQIEPDAGVALAKQLVYVLALKQWSVEVFYDAGNATGSPLGPTQGAKVSVGCRHADSVQELEGTLFWISQARDGGTSAHLMDQLKPAQISTPAVERLLQEADYTTVYSWTGKLAGHKFYVVTLVNSNLTLVYDMASQQWYQWTDSNGNYLPFTASTYTSDQQLLLQHASNGKMYKMEMATTTDDGLVITVDIYTPNFDAGARLRKYVKSIDFIADQTSGSKLQIRHSDDDYQTWTNFRTVDLGQKRPRLTDCGTFRRRAWNFRHACETPLRIQFVELHIDIGTL